MRPLVLLGRPLDALERLELDLVGPGGPNAAERNMFPLLLANLGRKAEALDSLERIMSAISLLGSPRDVQVTQVVPCLEAAILLGQRNTAEAIAGFLEPLQRQLTNAFWYLRPIDSLLGSANAFLGNVREARACYTRALEVCAKIRFRPEIALTRLGLAELLLEHYPDERPAAIEHLDFAIAEFREMKMQPSLERALKHKELLKA
jgi:tetratricopeptide (TPR) repeat protein